LVVFLALIVLINIFGVLGFGEEEFWSSVLKLGAIVTFMIIALVLVLGGGKAGTPYDEYYGARLFYDPGAFANGFKGVCAVFVTAAFAFSGTEIVGLAAAEAANPAKALPGAIKQVFWRITLSARPNPILKISTYIFLVSTSFHFCSSDFSFRTTSPDCSMDLAMPLLLPSLSLLSMQV
jgi:amino acid transporter